MKSIRIFNTDKQLQNMEVIFSFTCTENGKNYVAINNKNYIFEDNSRYANLDILEIIKEKGNTIYISDIPDEDWDTVKKALQFKVFAKLNK